MRAYFNDSDASELNGVDEPFPISGYEICSVELRILEQDSLPAFSALGSEWMWALWDFFLRSPSNQITGI
jgi:hypothetical protein